MRIPLAFELNHDEAIQLEALWEELSRNFPAFFGQFYEDPAIIQGKKIIQDKISLIRDKARERSLKHFASRHQELLTALKGEINNSLVELVTLEKSRYFSWLSDQKSWRENVNDSFSPYLAILNDNERSEILAYIDYAFTNREQIFSEAQKKNTLTPIHSAEVVRPKTYIAPNTKASNRAFGRNNAPFYEGAKPLAVERRNSKKSIDVYMSLRYDDSKDIGIKLCGPYQGKTLTQLDKLIHDAIVTQYVDGGNQDITNHMIFQVISGNEAPSSEKGISPEWNRRINESIDRMFHSVVEIDATEQAKAYGFEELHYKGHVLNCSIITAKINGQITTCVHICEPPALYKYADNCGQVIRTDLRMLNVPDFQNTPENAVLKNYLLQQIRIMQYSPKYSRTIRYDTVFDLLEIQAESEAALRMKKKQIRDKIKICLDYWKAEGLITGYKENKKGKIFDSITLCIHTSRKLPRKNT